jgi:hypothetical protein
VLYNIKFPNISLSQNYIFHLKNAPEVYNNIILIFQEYILKNLNGWVILKILISWNILSNFMKFFYHILILLKVILETCWFFVFNDETSLLSFLFVYQWFVLIFHIKQNLMLMFIWYMKISFWVSSVFHVHASPIEKLVSWLS